MSKRTTKRTSDLARAYAALTQGGHPVTVRALAAQAGVQTGIAGEWLKANRPAPEDLEAPLDRLLPGVAVIWAAAVASARELAATDHAASLAAHAGSEAQALQDSERLRTDLQNATTELNRMRAGVEKAEKHLAEVREQADQGRADLLDRLNAAERTAASERDRAGAAEARAERAEATASTLQRVLDEQLPRRSPE